MIALRQTLALFVDAYRELAAGKIFWITMILNVLIVATFAMIGIDEEGVSFLIWDVGFIPLTSEQLPPDLMYKQIFTGVGVSVWLGWAATILGLISTAGIIPNFVSGGTIEVHLSKPIGRSRLFLTKYITGLFFMALQVGVFAFGVFLLIGTRGGDWEPRVFIAVPVLVAMFSFLYCVSALLGLLTKSSVASLLLTVLFWILIFLFNSADAILLTARTSAEIRYDNAVARVERAEAVAEASLLQIQSSGESLPPESEWADNIRDELEAANPVLSSVRNDRDEKQVARDAARRWHRLVLIGKTVIPKTQETIELLDRSLLSEEDYERILGLDDENDIETAPFGGDPVSQSELTERMSEARRSRTLAWVLGTSFGFEAFVLLIATLIFARRDY